MKRIVVTGQWVNTLPLPHTRPYTIGLIYKAATETGWNISLPGKHWDS